jgi:hypothetical protein
MEQRMPKGIYERKPKDPPIMATETAAAPQPSPEPPVKLFPVLLTKHYAPQGKYEIVGYLKEQVTAKDAGGNVKIIEPEEFVEGVMKPAPSPGVGFPGKIWAGTTIKLPPDEAKFCVAKKIAERADDIAA